MKIKGQILKILNKKLNTKQLPNFKGLRYILNPILCIQGTCKVNFQKRCLSYQKNQFEEFVD